MFFLILYPECFEQSLKFIVKKIHYLVIFNYNEWSLDLVILVPWNLSVLMFINKATATIIDKTIKSTINNHTLIFQVNKRR